MMVASGVQASGRPGQAARDGRGRALAIIGCVALAVALGCYAVNLATHPLAVILGGNDLLVYQDAGRLARQDPGALYSWQLSPGVRFTYPPFAALIFGDLSPLSWTALRACMAVVSIAALALTTGLTFRQLGWRGRPWLGAACAVTAVAFWTEPVQRALHVGQVELLLMLAIVWDLGRPCQAKLKGAAIGIAAGIKLVPLLFIGYLAITRQFRQAAVAAGCFAGTVALGFVTLPRDSVHWWLGLDFLRAGRAGFGGLMINQSLRGLAIRLAGSVPAAAPAWLAAAVAVGAAGMLAAALLHRAGRPVHAWLACALTALLVSPVSWDHHWVWIAPGLAVLADLAARARGAVRWGWLALAGVVAAVSGAWPSSIWSSHPALIPWGLIWYAPITPAGVGDHPGDAEYHWHGLAWLAGNLYVLAGLGFFVALLAVAWRGRRTGAADRPVPVTYGRS